MNMQSGTIPEAFGAGQAVTPGQISTVRRLYWSVQRELWENRWVYLAPLGVAAVFLVGFFLSTAHQHAGFERLARLAAAHEHEAGATSDGLTVQPISGPYDLAADAMMVLAILIGIFYSADALHGERRDRSILFWKSMPVSDTTTVLAKASVVIVVVPLFLCALAFVMWWIMLLSSSLVLLAHGVRPALLWAHLPLFKMWGLLTYHIVTAHAIWPAPIYCWLLLVSGWARRAVLLWAALPVLIIGVLEKLTLDSWSFVHLVGRRLIGDAPVLANIPQSAFPADPMAHITAGRFFASSGLWLGLLVCAVFLFAAVRLRRSHGAI